MASHYDRQLGMCDGKIYPFKGMVDCGPPPEASLLEAVKRICVEVAKERRQA
jgi:hypothetical protein